jgi:16S rRNA (cytosine1402-N4)-methyltransferase
VSFIHATVMAEEAVRLLEPRPGAIYCDATLGGGGHAERILDASAPVGLLVGIDRDESALEAARVRLERFGARVTLAHGEFGDARAILERLGVAPVDGFLLDLGVSSPQLDRAERGFSFQREGPLDMRMDPSRGESAHALIERISVGELETLLREWGEERFAGRIARVIKEELPRTTTELAALIARTVPTRERHKDPATRTFQALRIAVNDELGQLERFLDGFVELLKPGGRVVVIAFHSLEDRIVKWRFRQLKQNGAIAILTKKPLVPERNEMRANPRARSAKLRAAVRA